MILKYGRGRVIFDSNLEAKTIIIRFRGNPFILHKFNTVKRTNTSSKGYIFFGKNIVSIIANLKDTIFRYYGYLKITKCTAVLSNGESVNVAIKTMNINLPELMSEFPEDISAFPNKLRQTYIFIRKFKGRQYKPSRTARTTARTSTVTTRTSSVTTRTGGY